MSKREGYDRTIGESEKAYLKILESSQVLLSVVKKGVKELRCENGSNAEDDGAK
jgi:hypothetical protein